MTTQQQKFAVIPQDNIDTFSQEHYEDRLNHLTNLIMEKLVKEDLKQWVLQHKKKFEPVPPYPYGEIEIRERFYEKARAEAERIIEEERKLFVRKREEHITRHLNLIIKQAKLLVFTADGKGKIHRKRVSIVGSIPAGSPFSFREDFYFEQDNPIGREIYFQIVKLKNAIGSYRQYVPYMSEKVSSLYWEANRLLDLEVVDDAEKTQKTNKEKETE